MKHNLFDLPLPLYHSLSLSLYISVYMSCEYKSIHICLHNIYIYTYIYIYIYIYAYMYPPKKMAQGWTWLATSVSRPRCRGLPSDHNRFASSCIQAPRPAWFFFAISWQAAISLRWLRLLSRARPIIRPAPDACKGSIQRLLTSI